MVYNADTTQEAVDKNYQAFRAMLPDLIKTNLGKFALMHDEQIVEFFDTARDAMLYGEREFPDGVFSVQQVTTSVVDLGYFSHALPVSQL